MKRFGKRIFCGILTVCMLSSLLCTFASARSSAYLDGYSAHVTAKSGGLIVVTVDVSGRGSMTEIGASYIYIYESSDNQSFHQVAHYYYKTNPQMMGSGTTYYKDAITYMGEPGLYYLASVYVYAAKDGGSDEKNYTTSSVMAIA